MKRAMKISFALLLAGSLTACQGSPLKGWSFARPQAATPPLSAPISGSLTFEEGRSQLRQGMISAAVASFRLALLDPVTAADANNGLGVAYAKLGRHDLAARYFQAAIALAPTDTRYAANMLRLEYKAMLARQATGTTEARLAQAAAAETARETRSVAHRRSDGIFHIRTAEASTSPSRMAVEYRRRVARVALADVSPPEAPADEPAGKVAAMDDGDKSKVIVIER